MYSRKKILVVAVFVLATMMALAGCGGSGSGSGDAASDAATEEAADEGAAADEAADDAATEVASDEAESAAAGDAYALYEAASKSMMAAEGYEADMTVVSSTDTAGTPTESESTSHVVVSDPDGDIAMKSVTTTDVEGTSVETTTWISGGYAYTDMAGQKIKMKMDLSQISSRASNMVSFPKESIVDEKVSDADGGKKIEFTIKGEGMGDYVKSQMGEMFQDDAAGITYGDSTITALIGADGNLLESTTSVSFEIDMDGTKVTSSSTTTMSNVKVGKVDIGLPADLDAYEEFDLSGLTGE
jgi:hypothetical protein